MNSERLYNSAMKVTLNAEILVDEQDLFRNEYGSTPLELPPIGSDTFPMLREMDHGNQSQCSREENLPA